MPDPEDSAPDTGAATAATDRSSPPDTAAPRPGRRRFDPPRDRTPLLMAAVVVLAMTAVVLAGWAVLRPASGLRYNDAQRADAKAQLCAAFDTVARGVSRNTHLQIPAGDAAAGLGAAANARISLYDGGQYLLARMRPATPTELADSVGGFANTLMDLGSAATAGALDSDPDQATRLASIDAANAKIGQLCVG